MKFKPLPPSNEALSLQSTGKEYCRLHKFLRLQKVVSVSNLCITTCDYNTLAKSTTKFSERFFLVLVSDAKEELCKVLYSFSKMSGRKTFEAQLIEK